ncbi:MAG: nucleoside triphosphate pyrophosphohydrolase [Clostridia bacterium]
MTTEILLEKFGGYTLTTKNNFLKRSSNTFDTNLPLVINNIDKNNLDEIKSKVEYNFGKVTYQIENDILYVLPTTFFEKTQYTFGDLVEIIHRLRDDDGCMWDKAQTNMTIRANAIEEAYELVEAVELDNSDKMKEEFGDVLLQGIFNAVISEDEKKFGANEVVTGLCQKLITRHTHIFGKDKATTEKEALICWEKAKAVEKKQKNVMDKISDVPFTFNALMRAYKVQKIIKKTGFDFPNINEAIDKIYEEVDEFIKADKIDKESEAGDMLFSVVNVLRMSNIDPEVALTGTTTRFVKRFKYVIEQAELQGKKVEQLSLEQMDKFYQEYKKIEEKNHNCQC